MKVENVILEEVINEYGEISKMPIGNDEHVKAVNAANSMLDRLNESKKIAIEQRKLDIEEEKLEVENKKIESDKKGRIAGYVLNGLMFAASMGVTLWGYVDSKKFEQGFTHTTEAGRQSNRNLLSFMDKFKFK